MDALRLLMKVQREHSGAREAFFEIVSRDESACSWSSSEFHVSRRPTMRRDVFGTATCLWG